MPQPFMVDQQDLIRTDSALADYEERMVAEAIVSALVQTPSNELAARRRQNSHLTR